MSPRSSAPALYDRKNFVGHLTAGALIVSRQTGCVLLLKHKQLASASARRPCGSLRRFGARCRFPGGARGDGDRSGPAGAARAERLLAARFPADADGHYIPPCPSKGEDEHRHFDMRFVFLFDGDSRVVIDRAESDGFRWVTLDELASMPDFRRVAPKIRAALSEREIAF